MIDEQVHGVHFAPVGPVLLSVELRVHDLYAERIVHKMSYLRSSFQYFARYVTFKKNK